MDEISTTTAGNRGNTNNPHSNSTTIDAFRASMHDAGIHPPDAIIGDGKLHRFKLGNSLNGRYILHLDGRAAGFFMDMRQGISHRWKMAGDFKRLTDSERQAFKVLAAKQAHDRKIEEAAKHGEAAKKANFIWSKAMPIMAQSEHPYLIKKSIQPHGLRISRGALIIPLWSSAGEIVKLQFIDYEGNKRLLSGGRKRGCFYAIGVPTETILICEGFATGFSLYEHSGHFVVVAMDAGNLELVAVEIRKLYPKAEIIIAADNDESRIGEQKARLAALAISCNYIVPPVIGDFNDYLAGGV